MDREVLILVTLFLFLLTYAVHTVISLHRKKDQEYEMYGGGRDGTAGSMVHRNDHVQDEEPSVIPQGKPIL